MTFFHPRINTLSCILAIAAFANIGGSLEAKRPVKQPAKQPATQKAVRKAFPHVQKKGQLLKANVRTTDEIAEMPQIQIDENGDAVVLWLSYTSTTTRIKTATATGGGSWGSTEILSNTDFDSFNPKLVMNDNGDCVAIWNTSDSELGVSVLYASIRPVGGSWTPAEPLSAPGETVFDLYKIDVNENLEIVVAWTSYEFISGNFNAFSSTFIPGTPDPVENGSWTSPTLISQ